MAVFSQYRPVCGCGGGAYSAEPYPDWCRIRVCGLAGDAEPCACVGCGGGRAGPIVLVDHGGAARGLGSHAPVAEGDAGCAQTVPSDAAAMLGAGVVQINLLIDMILASTLPLGSISFLYYADRVNQLPLGVIGVAIGTALLPMLSRHWHTGDDAAALETQNRALEFGALLTVPAAIGLMVLATPIITVLFERGAFEAADTAATATAMMAFAAGLPAFVLVKVLQPGFLRVKIRKPL